MSGSSLTISPRLHCEYRLFYVLPEAWYHYTGLLRRLWDRNGGTGSERAETSNESSDSEKRGGVESEQDVISNHGADSEWGLIPFHRWARIQAGNRPPILYRLLSLFRLPKLAILGKNGGTEAVEGRGS